MDRSADLEMPSPKRIRLEAPGSHLAIDPATPVEDVNNLFATPLAPPYSPTKSSHVLLPAFPKPASTVDQKPFQLPGLGMLDGDAVSSSEITQQQSQEASVPEIEQSSSMVVVKDMELENRQKGHMEHEHDSAVEAKRISDIQTMESKHTSPISNEILMGQDDTRGGIFEEGSTEAEMLAGRDVKRSGPAPVPRTFDWHSSGTIIENGIWLGSGCIQEPPLSATDSNVRRTEATKLVQPTLNWHSSGTIIDNGAWLGGYSIAKTRSTTPDAHTARPEFRAEAGQDKDGDQGDEKLQGQFLPKTKLVAQRSEMAAFEKPSLEDPAEANKDNEEAEFELDSSPLDSDSSSDDSTDTSSSDDSDAEDYEMLSPAEQARRLMAEDGGSDGEGKGKGRKDIAEMPRTLNEKPDEFVPKPTVTVTEDMEIQELGLVENIVENLALIKAHTSGEYQVLEAGSLLCLQERSVIGVVSETLGRVQQPYYSVRFTNATAIAEAGVEKGRKIFYVTQHSTSVFTQPLKAFKGSDASNLHDEEVGNDELEFSDDEAEAEHKRQIKQQRMAKRNVRDGQPDGYSRGPQQRPGRPGPRLEGGLHPVQERPPSSTEAALNYDDADGTNVDSKEDEDGPYTPLTRPPNLHEMLLGNPPPMKNREERGNVNGGRGGSRGGNRGSNRGRGDHRGRGGNRGMRDSERGGKQARKDHGNHGGKGQAYGHPVPSIPQRNGFSPSQNHGLPPRPSPEATSYQHFTPQGTGFPYPSSQQSPTPLPAYHNQQQPPQPQQPQFHTQPSYPSQNPNAYNQSYLQQPPPHHSYPPYTPQQNYPPYHQHQQSVPPQQGSYGQHFAHQPDMSFAPPGPQYPSAIPPGAHINPNLFKQQAQQSPPPPAWQQGYNQQQQQQQQSLAPFASGGAGSPAAAVPNEARLQDLLRGLGRGGG